MLRVECKQCGASAYTDNGADPDAALACPCCVLPHDHAAAANACPGAGAQHAGVPCPEVESGAGCTILTPLGEACPGGHCGLGVPGCTVCRPVNITLYGIPVS